mmetsp:Transcript_15767/g.32294  ORF Transcript_15767/g.32294 Transcript_15767/m.32294 type:complete len:528 (+) Transcript_15767:59-1642(+)
MQHSTKHTITTMRCDAMRCDSYEQLVHAIIRPPRAKYKMEQLGPPEFIFLQQRFRRDDVELLSSNVAKNEPSEGEKTNAEGGASPTCSFLKMQASIWTRVVDDDDDGNDPNPYNHRGRDNGDADADTDGDQDNQDQSSATSSSPNKKHTMVIYLHGNASARVEVVPSLSFLLGQMGVSGVVAVDFTGSGKSDGDYVSLGYYERVDLDCLIQYLKRVYGGPDGDDLEIVLWGRSMGASTALMHAGKKSFTATNNNKSYGRQTSNTSTEGKDEARTNTGTNESVAAATAAAAPNNNSILKGLVCDSPFASLLHLCEELVEKARAQGVVVPGVVISVAIAMIARSVRHHANFNIREITPIEDVPNIDVPALFIVGKDDDFITPQHSERLVEAYKKGVTTNIFMIPGGHNDARPQIVYDGILAFCRHRLSLTEESALEIPPSMLSSIHQNPPWAYHRTVHFQAYDTKQGFARKAATNETTNANGNTTAAEDVAENLGMTKDRQEDIQNRIGLMMGGQGDVHMYSSDEEDDT